MQYTGTEQASACGALQTSTRPLYSKRPISLLFELLHFREAAHFLGFFFFTKHHDLMFWAVFQYRASSCQDDTCFCRRSPSLLRLRPSLLWAVRLRHSRSANDWMFPPHPTHTHWVRASVELSVQPKPQQSALVCPRWRWRGATVKGTPSLSWRIQV